MCDFLVMRIIWSMTQASKIQGGECFLGGNVLSGINSVMRHSKINENPVAKKMVKSWNYK